MCFHLAGGIYSYRDGFSDGNGLVVCFVCFVFFCFIFFFQAEDGIRDVAVTGVQTCALPI